jgi:prephenate dehydrogenase
MKIGIVGLGLIGGSVAKALKKAGKYDIAGVDIDAKTEEEALSSGAIGSVGGIDACDVVYVCLHPADTVQYLLGNDFKPGAVLTDVCGVKRLVMERVSGQLREKGYLFAGSHPMAGKERGGFANSDAGLFSGASYILVRDEHTDPKALSLLSTLALDMGFARVTRSTPDEHDRMIAYTSQLAHVVSNAYVKNPLSGQKGFSAGSFEDLTRVARLDHALWAELFLENSEYICAEIDTLLAHIGEIRDAVRQKNGRLLRSLLEDGSRIKEEISRQRSKST